MSHDFFYKLAEERGCQAIDAAKSIRRHAIKKNGDEQVKDDTNLLPTVETLRKPTAKSKDGVFSAGRIQNLLRCDCRGLCGVKTSRTDKQDDQQFSQQIYSDSGLLKLFALLCMTGCLFLMRSLFEEHLRDPAALTQIEHGDEPRLSKLKQDLFSPYKETVQIARREHRERHADNVDRLAKIFSECINSKLWLFRIRKISLKDRRLKFSLGSKENLPFVHESVASDPRDSRRFFKFKIAPGYCDGDAAELNDTFLFRKQIKIDHTRSRNGATVGEEEALTLSYANDMKHENIAQLLFTIRETETDCTYISLVFRWYEHDLEKILEGKASVDALIPPVEDSPPGDPLSPLDDHLWKSMLGVVDAVKNIHNMRNVNVPLTERETLICGHFDIKPANILVNSEQGQLLLADFGQAHIKKLRAGQSSALTAHPGTPNYRPPPSGSSKLHLSYDTWSLACVLLEVLLFVTFKGPSSVKAFYRERFNEDRPNNNASFWTTGNDGKPKLRPSVEHKIQQLIQRGDPDLARVAREISRMLSIDERDRPVVSKSLKVFRGEVGLDFTAITHPGQIPILRDRLQQMDTSFSMGATNDLVQCDLYLWRGPGLPPQDKDQIQLILSLGNPPQSHSEITVVENDLFVPESTFDANAAFSMSVQPVNTTKCKFMNMHASFTLHFHKARDFFEFQTIVTSQMLCSPRDGGLVRSPLRGAKLAFESCTIHIQGTWSKKLIEFGAGRVQMWRLLSQANYEKRYHRTGDALHSPKGSSGSSFEAVGALSSGSSGTVADGLKIVPRSDTELKSNDRRGKSLKLAFFVFGPSRPASLFMYLERNDYGIEFPPDAPRLVTIRRPPSGYQKFFRMALFGSQGTASTGGVRAGVPLDPNVLNEAIDGGLKVKECVFTMTSDDARRQLQRMYEDAFDPSER